VRLPHQTTKDAAEWMSAASSLDLYLEILLRATRPIRTLSDPSAVLPAAD
jgi:hypothetical protein